MKNEKLINLIREAQGNRTQNQFALHTDINSSSFTRIYNGEYLPKPDVLKKIASKAHNGITYEDLMIAAGNLQQKSSSEQDESNDSSPKIIIKARGGTKNFHLTEKQTELLVLMAEKMAQEDD